VPQNIFSVQRGEIWNIVSVEGEAVENGVR
jgi:hypothetical protein